MADPNVNIKVTTSADTSGADKTRRALGEVVGDNAKRGAEGLNRTFEGLNQAMQGGAGLARGLGTALAGAFQAVGKAVWVGYVIQGIGLVIANFEKLRGAFGETAKKAEEDAAATAKAWSEGLADAGRVRDEKLKTYFEDIAREAARAATQIDAVTTAMIAQTDADEAVRLAQIEASDLDPVAKLEQKAAVRSGAREARLKTEINSMALKDAQAATTAQRARDGAQGAEAAVGSAGAVVQSVEADDPERLRELLRLRTALASPNPNAGPEQNAAARAKIAQIDAENPQLKERLDAAGPDDENYKTRLAAAKAAVLAAEASAKAARERAAEETRKAAELAEDNAARARLLQIQSGGQESVDTIQTGASLRQERVKAARAAAEAAELAAVGAQAGGLAANAQKLGRDPLARSDPAVMEAARALNDAAKAAQTAGTTAEERQELITAMTAVAKSLAAHGVESAHLRAMIKLFSEQGKNARTQ